MHRPLSPIAIAGIFALVLALLGCQPGGKEQGIQVYFNAPPTLYKQDVYWQGQAIGKILGQETGQSPVTRVTIALDAPFESKIGPNWAFFANNGRLHAGRLAIGAEASATEIYVNGFTSKAAFNWFKFKTLINDRVGKAKRRAGRLHARFH